VWIDALRETGEAPDMLHRGEFSKIGYINAHGSGTLHNDAAEARAISLVFSDFLSGVIISSTKGAIGHLLGATGLVEAVVTIEMLRRQKVLGTIGLCNLDPKLEVPVLKEGESRSVSMSHALSTTYGFGGVNSAIIFCRDGR
jgi:3-oxoacyl-[acyl-carrier-protein] synthase II